MHFKANIELLPSNSHDWLLVLLSPQPSLPPPSPLPPVALEVFQSDTKAAHALLAVATRAEALQLFPENNSLVVIH